MFLYYTSLFENSSFLSKLYFLLWVLQLFLAISLSYLLSVLLAHLNSKKKKTKTKTQIHVPRRAVKGHQFKRSHACDLCLSPISISRLFSSHYKHSLLHYLREKVKLKTCLLAVHNYPKYFETTKNFLIIYSQIIRLLLCVVTLPWIWI